MTTPALPEAWLRGPIVGIDPQLFPAAHALLQVVEDVENTVRSLSLGELWLEVGGAASVGFHLKHIAGSIDRLLTYARGGTLDELQRSALAAEKEPGNPAVVAAELIGQIRRTVENALQQFKSTRAETLFQAREVGRARLPSTVLGLFFHAAEHAQRHTGQIITTVKILRGLSERTH